MRRTFFALGMILGLSACATVEPEVCTSEWVSWKTTAITDSFARQYRSELRDLQQFSHQLEDPSPLVLLQMTTRISEFRVIAVDFSEQVVPELQAAMDTCGTPTRFASAFTGFLEEQGVDGAALNWVEEIAGVVENNLANPEG